MLTATCGGGHLSPHPPAVCKGTKMHTTSKDTTTQDVHDQSTHRKQDTVDNCDKSGTSKSTARNSEAGGTHQLHKEWCFSYTAVKLSPSLSTGGNNVLGCPEADMDIDF